MQKGVDGCENSVLICTKGLLMAIRAGSEKSRHEKFTRLTIQTNWILSAGDKRVLD
jgi:hypothetical protein